MAGSERSLSGVVAHARSRAVTTVLLLTTLLASVLVGWSAPATAQPTGPISVEPPTSRPGFCAEVSSFYLQGGRPTRFYAAEGVPLFPEEHRAADSYTTQAGSTLTALASRCTDGTSVTVTLVGDARLRLADGTVVRERWYQTDVLTRHPDGTIAVLVSTTRIPLPGQAPADGTLTGTADLDDGPSAALTVTFAFPIPCPDGQPVGATCTLEAAGTTVRAEVLTTVGGNTIVVRDADGEVVATIPLGEPTAQFSTDPAVVGAG